jgi:cell division protein ZapD
VASYEFPFNERIRALLRLEDLFKKVLFHVESGDQYNHHCALILLLQMLDLIERTDIKIDIMHELDRQIASMQNLLGNPNIATEILTQTLAETKVSVAKLRAENSKIGQSLRDNEWLMSIKKRTSIPGGACQFDLPSYHYWLNRPLAQRNKDFNLWLAQLLPMYESIKIILHMLRSSGMPHTYRAKKGYYQKMLEGTKAAQLLQIEVIDDCACFPEISANKYAINVRFYTINFNDKSTPCDIDIDFKMTLCNLM